MFWVVDNGSSHRGDSSVYRLTQDWPNAHLIHLPVHASWLNQVEIYFSVLQRKVLDPNDVADLDELQQRLSRLPTALPASSQTVRMEVHRQDLAKLLQRVTASDLQRAA